nr:S-layer homology domain-containing protein [Lysinibacillus timonensis]
MRLIKQWILCLLLMIVITSSVSVEVSYAAPINSEEVYNQVASYMVDTVPNPKFGNEWFIIALARGNYEVPKSYYDTYYKNLVRTVQDMKGELHSRKFTEYARVVLALSAIGKDATNVGGYNLVEKLYDFEHVIMQGINGPIFALIALDSWKYEIPATASNSRKKMIDYILSKQLDDGGFALSGTKADPDITSMAVQALSTYSHQPEVKLAIDRALGTLVSIQGSEGSYASWGVTNSESVAQVIVALTSVGIDPTEDTRFRNVVPQLLTYFDDTTGGFKHVLDRETDGMATEQAGYALASYHRQIANKTKLYDMLDTKTASHFEGNQIPNEQNETKFYDINNHWAKEFIEEASNLGLLNGFPDGSFKPNQYMTRLQATSIIVQILDLTATEDAPYKDISSLDEGAQSRIAAAFEAGIIVYENDKYKPNEKITRVELAQMLGRAFTYKNGSAHIPKKLAPYSDIQQYNDETKNSISLLYDLKIATGSNGLFNPTQFTTRAHSSVMFVNFYKQIQ